MRTRDERTRTPVAAAAAEWFIANRDASLDQVQRGTFTAWLKESPVHVEEYLTMALIARELHAVGADPQVPLGELLARARNNDDASVVPIRSDAEGVPQPTAGRSWRLAWATAVALAVLSVALLWRGADQVQSLRYSARHGEQLTQRLADTSLLRLNSDSSVTVRYSRSERIVEIARGQVLFEVAHEAQRPFRVLAGAAQVVAVGTKFDVYLQEDSTRVTVLEGQVAVGLAQGGPGAAAGRSVPVQAGEQVRVTAGALPAAAEPADVSRNSAWVRHEIVFEQEPLGRVAAEFNRYSAKPIEIETPALRALVVSGTFAADDTESFIAFLRTLQGVRVEVTATRIRVSKQ